MLVIFLLSARGIGKNHEWELCKNLMTALIYLLTFCWKSNLHERGGGGDGSRMVQSKFQNNRG